MLLQEAGKPAVYACSLVERLNEAGISVAGIDLQGRVASFHDSAELEVPILV